jgi:hypothetical protein
MANLTDEVRQRWDRMFAALASGDDVSPALRLRTEGMMEAVALLELASCEELVQWMDERYRAAFGRDLAQDFGEDWQDFYPFPQIPAMGKRAPVYPSTKD